MKNLLRAACCGLLLLGALPAWAAPALFVKLHDDGAAASALQRKQRLAAVVAERGLPLQVREQVTGRWLRLQATAALSGSEREALLARLRADPRVAQVLSLQREQRLAVTPNDTRFADQWWLQPRGTGNTGSADFSTAWMRRVPGNSGGTGPVAVLDSGISYHPDLFANVLPGHDFVSDADYAGDGDGRDADPNDEGDAISDADRTAQPAKFSGCPPQAVSGWHGTIIAGQVGAMTANGNGVAGAGFNTAVLPVRVAAKCGADPGDIVAGMRWAAGLVVDGVPLNPNPARIVVISYGSEDTCNALYQDAIAEVRAAGTMVIAAAGNQRRGVFRPASCAGAFAVTALNREGYKATYANYGPQVQIATPGGDDATGGSCDAQLSDGGLVSTGNLGDVQQGAAGYVAASGTSFAAPAVAATAALMLGVNPTLSLAQLEAGLRASAAPFVQVPLLGQCAATDNPGRCTCTTSACGAGQLDADQALVFAAAPGSYVAPVRNAVTLRDNRIEACAIALGRPVPPEPTPPPTPAPTPTPEPEGGGGGASSPLWLLGLAVATAGLRRRRG
ncbi:MAG: S8 family serine peptidase [Rubrivivax sp.]|nr:S8 family serine peptidase [Rubrivivax sp.]